MARGVIGALEWVTGRPRLERRLREFERREAMGGDHRGARLWGAALDCMGIAVRAPPAEVARIPARGPVGPVANHPHGLVDGMVVAALVARVRPDLRVLARALLSGIHEGAAASLIPVPFPHEAGADAAMLEMRRRARAHLARGGLVALFPAGRVASAPRGWGEAEEGEWSPFTANLIRGSGATVLPVRFGGANSRAYQVAARLSPLLRQGSLLREVAAALDHPQDPVVGEPIPPEAWRERAGDPRAFSAWLRERTLSLQRP